MCVGVWVVCLVLSTPSLFQLIIINSKQHWGHCFTSWCSYSKYDFLWYFCMSQSLENSGCLHHLWLGFRDDRVVLCLLVSLWSRLVHVKDHLKEWSQSLLIPESLNRPNCPLASWFKVSQWIKCKGYLFIYLSTNIMRFKFQSAFQYLMTKSHQNKL